MAGTLEENTNTTTRIVAQTNTGQDEKPTKRTKSFRKIMEEELMKIRS